MKHTGKILSLVLALGMLFSLAACGGGANSPGADKTYTVGVIQFGSHPSLDNCYTGIKQGLDASGLKLTVDLQNGNFDSATCDSIAKNMVAKNYDMIIAIATPAAMSAYAAAANTKIPVVFCAVSDPVAAQLVNTLDAPGGNATGTSDVLDFSAQLSLITTLQPDVKKIGVLYTTSEANSVSQLGMFKAAAGALGLEVVDQGVQTAADVPQAAATLCAKVDCVNNFTDNNVVSQLQVLLTQANANGIPVYGSEVEQVKNGCLAAMSIDYVALGKVTGQMAADILNGANPATMAVKTISDATPVINTDVLASFGMTLPDIFKNAQLVTTATPTPAA